MNAKPTQRKQLSEQLDRLDTIIDALGEGLPGAVADACREGARLALKDALIEILTNPELRALLAAAVPATPAPMTVPTAPAEPPPPAAPKRPSLWSRLKSKARAARAAIFGVVVRAKEAIVGRCRTAQAAVHAVGLAGGEPAPVRQIAGTALLVGVVVGTACLLLPDTVAAVVGGVSAATTTVCVQVCGWLRRVACRVGLLG
ncbi:MAG: hypothetical protein U0792_22735 [Gemmataceae bacterium]